MSMVSKATRGCSSAGSESARVFKNVSSCSLYLAPGSELAKSAVVGTCEDEVWRVGALVKAGGGAVGDQAGAELE